MRFILTEDQEALRDGIRALCTGRFTMERVREGFDREVWKELAEAGVFTLPELGFGLPEETIVLEELGRALVPGPLVWGVLAHSAERVVTGCDGDVVTHLDAADDVLGTADPAGFTPVAHPIDPLTPMHAGDGASPNELRVHGAVLTAAYLVGMAAACTDAAVAYAKEREQFDTPIGRFQSIKHLLADCLVRTELARAAVHAAAVEPTDRSASAAKVLAGDAAVNNAKTSFQVHGGMGFTWEVDVHLYLKRAWVLDRQFGTRIGMQVLYLHEVIDIVGEGARRYMELTERFDTDAAADRGLTLFGTWQVVGVTGRWPQVVNVWTIDGWDGWGRLVTAANVKRGENKPLAEWWQEAYATRTGGFDRLLKAHGPVDDAAAGELWVHEVSEVRPGAAADYLSAIREEWAPVAAQHGHRLVGAFEVMFTDVEVVTLWATDVASHLEFEQADLEVDWPARRREYATRWREELLVPGPAGPA